MQFNPTAYGPEVASILSLYGNGERLAPLVCDRLTPEPARQALSAHRTEELFPNAAEPAAPMAGLWLYFSGFDEAHALIDDPKTPDGTYWHAIVHRQEPDASNAAYWFRLVGEHPAFHALAKEATQILERFPGVSLPAKPWDPFAFVELCEQARQRPESPEESAAREIQRAEWQILFDHSARSH